jgi:hypothetical protein
MDSTITLNTAICNLDRLSINPTKYDLLAVTAHEIDEALAFGSALNNLNNGDPSPTTIEADDLFRFDQTGARSYNTNLSTQAFFSVDGGTTDLARFNQSQGGDFSDWYSPGGQTPQIQDAFGTKGATANLGVELRRLDVLGYTRVFTAAPVVTAPADQVGVEGASQAFDLGSFSGGNGPWGVTVSWGDGSPDTTFFVASPGPLGTRSHTYAEEGNYLPKVTITDFTSMTGTATFHVGVSDPAVVASGSSFGGVEGAAITNQTVATFTDPGGSEASGDYAATIMWGDGSVSTGTITFNAGTFTVHGSHTYGEEGNYTISVKIDHDTAPAATVMGSVLVSDPAVLAAGVNANTTAGAPAFSVAVATFTDPGGAEPNASDPTPGIANHYSATINWGDGTPSSAGTVTFNSMTNTFTVSGNHVYAAAGSYTITTTINHEAVVTTAMSTAKVVSLGLFEQGAQTKTSGFWAGLLGQELIRKFGTTAGGQTLGQWLASTFPKLYGGIAGAPNLGTFTDAQVGSFYIGLFNMRNTSMLDSEVLSTALYIFATTSSLGGTAASSYGLQVNSFGLGAYSFNSGFNGAAFGVPNFTVLNIYQIMLAANNSGVGGVLWGGNMMLRNQGLSVFRLINGD